MNDPPRPERIRQVEAQRQAEGAEAHGADGRDEAVEGVEIALE